MVDRPNNSGASWAMRRITPVDLARLRNLPDVELERVLRRLDDSAFQALFAAAIAHASAEEKASKPPKGAARA